VIGSTYCPRPSTASLPGSMACTKPISASSNNSSKIYAVLRIVNMSARVEPT
jgi:hypothetical protein